MSWYCSCLRIHPGYMDIIHLISIIYYQQFTVFAKKFQSASTMDATVCYHFPLQEIGVSSALSHLKQEGTRSHVQKNCHFEASKPYHVIHINIWLLYFTGFQYFPRASIIYAFHYVPAIRTVSFTQPQTPEKCDLEPRRLLCLISNS